MSVIPGFLRAIPQSNEDAKTLSQLAGPNVDDGTIGALYGCAALLQAFGMVTLAMKSELAESTIKAASQTAKYTLLSLASFIESGQPIIPDWKTRGIETQGAGDLLNTGAQFLYALESRRLAAIENPPAIRAVKAAQLLIKRTNPDSGQAELLFQFDNNAQQYQLIGGRWNASDGDDLIQTVIRELDEELPHNRLAYGRDYRLDTVAENLAIPPILSPTFGALTEYRFWIYHVTGLQQELHLQPVDRWISIKQVLGGVISGPDRRQYPFHSAEIYQRLNALLPGGLASLPDSFESA